MKAYFIFKKLDEADIRKINKEQVDILLFLDGRNNDPLVGKCPGKKVNLDDYKEEIKRRQNYHFKTVELLKDWSDLKIDGDRISDILKIDGISLFDINFKFLSNGFLRWVLMSIDLFCHIFAKHSIDSAVILGEDMFYGPYIRIVSEKLGIPVESSSRGIYQARPLYIQILIRLLKLFFRTFLARCIRQGNRVVPADKKRKILSFIISDRHSRNLLPIYKFLVDSKKYNFFIINDLYGERLRGVISEEMGYLDLICYSNLVNFLKIRNFYLDITNKIKRIFSKKRHSSGFVYNGFPLDSLFERFILGEFYQSLLVSIEKIVLFRDLLRREKPDLILNCNDTKYVSSVALLENIKCISLIATSAIDLVDDGFVVSDKLLVGSATQKEKLLKVCDPSKIEVVGEVRFDNLNREEITGRGREYRLSKDIHNNEKVVVFISTYSYENDRFYFSNNELSAIFNSVYRVLSKLNDCILITKMHPYEKESSIHKLLAEKFGLSRFILEKDIDLFKLLAAADTVIDTGSTVGLDSVFMGKPLITFVPDRYILSDIYSFQEQGLSQMVFSEPDLSAALKKTLYDEETRKHFLLKRREYLESNLFDGKTNERVKLHIDSLFRN